MYWNSNEIGAVVIICGSLCNYICKYCIIVSCSVNIINIIDLILYIHVHSNTGIMLFCQKKGDVVSRIYTHYQHNKHTLHGNLW